MEQGKRETETWTAGISKEARKLTQVPFESARAFESASLTAGGAWGQKGRADQDDRVGLLSRFSVARYYHRQKSWHVDLVRLVRRAHMINETGLHVLLSKCRILI